MLLNLEIPTTSYDLFDILNLDAKIKDTMLWDRP